jgi:hypothetical protein
MTAAGGQRRRGKLENIPSFRTGTIVAKEIRVNSHPRSPLPTAPGNGQELVSRDPATTMMSRRASDELRPLAVRRPPGVFRPIASLPVPLDGEPGVDSLSRLRDEVDALAQRYLPPVSEDVIEREAFLYSAHPGKHLVPFYLWLSIRGYGTFSRKAG